MEGSEGRARHRLDYRTRGHFGRHDVSARCEPKLRLLPGRHDARIEMDVEAWAGAAMDRIAISQKVEGTTADIRLPSQ